jgi:hypothetical protein
MRVEESRMNKAQLNRRVLFLKITAAAVAVMIVISSIAVIQVFVRSSPENNIDPGLIPQSYQSRPCEVKTVLSQAVPWVSFDSEAPGTPAEANVIISDTTGITIVADFYGFWMDNYRIGATSYDDIKMPGTSPISIPGKPSLPILAEFVEIPHDIDVSIEVLATSNDTDSGYSIRPAPYPHFPVGIGAHSQWNGTQTTILPASFGSEYTTNALYPGVRARIRGRIGAAPLIVRGHRLLELTFCPIQYNNMTGRLLVFSQMVIRIKYSSPAQIQPIRESLRSDIFERILENSLIHYDPIHIRHRQQPGLPTSYSRLPPPPPSLPNATIPQYVHSTIPPGYKPGAEYLIITTSAFKEQAQRLADWKDRKGTPSRVEIISDDNIWDEKIRNVKGIVKNAYDFWYPAPSYVLLFGDVESIPTNYDMWHTWSTSEGPLFPGGGQFASDLSYFTVEGTEFFPDIIYSRISVDTEEQAEIVVNKTLSYEQSPPEVEHFYNSILTTGFFQDNAPNNGNEDYGGQFISHLENIRHYLQELEFDYQVHYNYSCYANPNEHEQPDKFFSSLDYGPGTGEVEDYLPGYEWLWGYGDHIRFRDEAAVNISSNINDGRFLVMYYSHGGSRNMKYSYHKAFSSDNRDLSEGWHTPFFTPSNFSLLQNEDKTPLILSMACSTGWFDGEEDQRSCMLTESDGEVSDNFFADYASECFAEEITRLDGGAIAAIAPSRQVPAHISGDLLDGMIRAFWPGFLGSKSQPIYEMGGALFDAKLYAAGENLDITSARPIVQMMYEGFHLFGDPETQLWTDFPSEFNVSYPEHIGTKNPQEIVVTVTDSITKEPVSNAKICVQQDPYIYQVGYSDCNGQVIFDVDPVDRSWSLNVTVTKHNFRPHIGEITVVESGKATVAVTPEIGLSGDSVRINITGFDDGPVTVYFDDTDLVTFQYGITAVTRLVPDGDNGHSGYVNVEAVHDNTGTVAVTRFYRLSTNQNPDPYIYSHKDPSTWYLADNELVWDNPCITIYSGTTPVDRVEQDRVYDVNVTVYNRGDGEASETLVTLWSASSLGSFSWSEIGNKTVTIPLRGHVEVGPFEWKPRYTNTVSLKVTISHGNEAPDDWINNEGTECWNIIPLCSVGRSTFEVENPSDDPEYVFINVKQEGDHDDVWSTGIEGYTSQAIDPDDSETATLVVDPGFDLGPEDGRTFTAEIYVDGEMVLGIEFNGICEHDIRQWIVWIILAIFIIFIVAIVIYVWKD